MNFSEPRFWGYLAAALAIVWIGRFLFIRFLKPSMPDLSRYDRTSILGVGLFLLGCVNVQTLGIFLFVCLITYWGLGLFLGHQGMKRWVFLLILIPLQLLPLLYYKYSDFLLNGIFQQGIPGLAGLVIPVGLSFYTFQVIGFVVDTILYRYPLPKFLDFMNFAGFFPQIVAGPIERREHLLPQMQDFRFRWDASAIDRGAAWIVLGLFFKICLADNLATFFDASFATNPYLIWLNNLIFGFRIYYDFAGYSFTALGIALCLGIKLTINFTSPYTATTAQEFWRCWHITLSTWFRDYLYIPLGGNRKGFWALNILVVFVISGIWHGAGWGFILWGGIWGLLLIFFHSIKQSHLPSVVGWSITLLGAFYAWLCFYETRTPILLQKLATISNPLNYGASQLREAISAHDPTKAFVMTCFFALVFATLALEWLSLRLGEKQPYWIFRKPLVLCILIVLTILLAPSEKNDFIYFAF